MTDPEVAARVFRTLDFAHHVLYIQEFVIHGTRDIRAFTVGDRLIAAMYRAFEGWKTNVSQGARPIPLKPNEEVEGLPLKAARAGGFAVAGWTS